MAVKRRKRNNRAVTTSAYRRRVIEIKHSKIRRRNFDAQPARPSRIRRDPALAPGREKEVRPYPTEREILVVVIGVIVFALGITALAFDVMYFV